MHPSFTDSSFPRGRLRNHPQSLVGTFYEGVSTFPRQTVIFSRRWFEIDTRREGEVLIKAAPSAGTHPFRQTPFSIASSELYPLFETPYDEPSILFPFFLLVPSFP